MNQGNKESHIEDKGVRQDGGLIYQFARPKQWVAIFLRFQNQSWHTNDTDGHSIAIPIPQSSPATEPTQLCIHSNVAVPDIRYRIIKIVAALVNDTQNIEKETVTILNTSNQEISLSGWSIADRQKNKKYLDGSIGPGGVRTISLDTSISLSNKGDTITLFDDNGIKVDGVAYSRLQVQKPGWTITF